MKPENWEKLSYKDKIEMAKELFLSMRGRYIISQALCKAIEVMKKEPKMQREVSNIEDMEMLGEIFPICFQLDELERTTKKEEK